MKNVKRYASKATALLLMLVFILQSTSILLANDSISNTDNPFADPAIWVPIVLEMQEQMLREADDFWANSELSRYGVDLPRELQVNYCDNDLIFGMRTAEFASLAPEIQLEIEFMELLAAIIFDYYMQNGYWLDKNSFSASLSAENTASLANVAPFMTANDASLLFQEKGFQVSALAVAAQAAWIAVKVGLMAAIPVIQVVALAVGATILVGGLIAAIHSAFTNRSAIAGNMGNMLGSMWSRQLAENTIVQARDLAISRNSGFIHFIALRLFDRVGGGIIVGPPLNVGQAVARHKTGFGLGRDTFSASFHLAMSLAQTIHHSWTISGIPSLEIFTRQHFPHNRNMPLNLPHLHVYRIRPGHSDAHLSGHIFY